MRDKEKVYEHRAKCPCWQFVQGDYTGSIVTEVWKGRNIFRRTRYRIRQFVPYIQDPFYDGEHSTNRALRTVAASEYFRAQQWIDGQGQVK